MKSIKILMSSFLMLALLVSSCSPETYSLDGPIDKSDIHFEITQDLAADAGGNTVILKNTTPGVILNWDYVTGKSDKAVQTVKYAFKGNYTIKVSAVTDAGIVELDPVTVTVTQDNLNYVNDPLWTALSGGVGKQKSWVLDNGKYGQAMGAMAYADPSTTVEWNNFSPNWEPEGMPPGSSEADMHWGRYMTFSLEGGPFMKVYEADGTLKESGTYFLDINTHTLTTTGATILRADNYVGNASNWTNNIKVLKLTENQLRIAIMRTNSEGPWWYIWNFVSKEYADNYVPPVTAPVYDEGFNPTFAPGELLKMLTGGAGTGRVWALDGNGNPVDWLGKGKGWTTGASSSYNWGWNDDWAATAGNSWIRFDQFGGKLNYTRSQNGVETTGVFTINEEKNEVNLGTNTLLQNPTSWMNPTTNTIKVVKAFNNDYLTKGIWFGTSYDAGKDEWFVFHYIIP
ncbi:hypothetical protein BD847_1451 [Flavobacterium cutihirudinis]|uniref:PKD domain-containing protein n=1 Tax=Flavobacterium cutihirudinis TaxID=1265740 RepID=A0A3D9FVI6_9FLAO|nr:hypothetical protein [Flavobacterium cutihirudinis]RED24716.1 hypothetical protein BD847_1451 [Flavobacterium cutihirudinis]